MNILNNYSLKNEHSFATDVKCDFFTSIRTLEQVKEIMLNSQMAKIPKLWLGRGNNILFAADFKGLVIQVRNKGIEELNESDTEVILRVQGGENWDDFINFVVSHQWWGVENLAAIPGSVGSAPIQNIGAYGVEVKDVIQKVEVLDLSNLKEITFENEQCEFDYRHSIFKQQKGKYLIWAVVFRLKKNACPQLSYANLLNEVQKESHKEVTPLLISKIIQNIRKGKLPEVGVLGSAGSFFKNPFVSTEKYEQLRLKFPNIVGFIHKNGMKIAAAWMIEYCGWKAFREGDAGVYPQQALVLVNYGNASGYDILKLANKIVHSVNQTFGVKLEKEVNIEGEYEKVMDIMFASLPMFQRVGAAAYKPNLNNTHLLMDALNHPETKFLSIHIAGTNGKGSTSHMLASVFQEAGYKTALYTSPHLRDFRERIKINGEMISKEAVVDFYSCNENLFHQIQSSFFEMTVAMAFDYFAKEKVDIAIVEVGMGGRLDSTNVLIPELSIITNISYDHTQFLGNTLEAIAGEKAGIIKQGIPIVIGNTPKESVNVFRKKADEMGSLLYYAPDLYKVEMENVDEQYLKYKANSVKSSTFFEGRCQLLGSSYQVKNLEVVYTALDIVKEKFAISEQAILNGIAKVVDNTGIMGRWQILGKSPLIICDTGHNKDGITNVITQLNTYQYQKLHFVLGFVNDKEVEEIINMLPKQALYYYCKADIPRGMEVAELVRIAQKANLCGQGYPSVSEALNAAKSNAFADDLIFVGGSTFVVAEVC